MNLDQLKAEFFSCETLKQRPIQQTKVRVRVLYLEIFLHKFGEVPQEPFHSFTLEIPTISFSLFHNFMDICR